MTPGSIVLWEEATSSLFTSDTLFDDPAPHLRSKCHHDAPPPTSADHDQRRANLQTLLDLQATTVYAGHFGRNTRSRMLQLIRKKLVRDASEAH